MTRRDYVLLSDALRGAEPNKAQASHLGWQRARDGVADALKASNPGGFDRERFILDSTRSTPERVEAGVPPETGHAMLCGCEGCR